jgi:hypothetical protein
MTVNSDGSSHVRPLVTNRPTPKVDLLAGRKKPKPATAIPPEHPKDCGCDPCSRGAARAAVTIAEADRKARVAVAFESFEPSRFMDGPRGSSVLDR